MGFPNKTMNFFLLPTRVLEMFLNWQQRLGHRVWDTLNA
jgi:hypothetical protein